MTEIRSLRNDLTFGLTKEIDLVEHLERVLCPIYSETHFINTKDLYNDEYCSYDFEGDINKTHIEVKSRRNTKYQYATTIIPVHKIQETDKKQVFVFYFTDQICYIEYNQQLFSTFNTRMIKVFRQGRYDPPTLHYEIPVNLLINFL
jgi:hypothetical protein